MKRKDDKNFITSVFALMWKYSSGWENESEYYDFLCSRKPCKYWDKQNQCCIWPEGVDFNDECIATSTNDAYDKDVIWEFLNKEI